MKLFASSTGLTALVTQNGIGGTIVALAHQIPVSQWLGDLGLSLAMDAVIAFGAAALCFLF